MAMTDAEFVTPGSYTITESTIPAGWSLASISCTGNAVSATTGSNSITVTVSSNEAVECTITNTFTEVEGPEVTRTQGFWATHFDNASQVWIEKVPDSRKNLCSDATHDMSNGPDVDDISEMESGFWSKIPRTSDNTKRTAIEQAAMQLLQQWLAGVLNESGLNAVTVYMDYLDDAQDALCGIGNPTKEDLRTLAGQIVDITEADATHSLQLPDGFLLGADPKAAKESAAQADTEWDQVLP